MVLTTTNPNGMYMYGADVQTKPGGPDSYIRHSQELNFEQVQYAVKTHPHSLRGEYPVGEESPDDELDSHTLAKHT
jgi:hypothetical protein